MSNTLKISQSTEIKIKKDLRCLLKEAFQQVSYQLVIICAAFLMLHGSKFSWGSLDLDVKIILTALFTPKRDSIKFKGG